MAHIERINIKNARRLGENVKIDFGSGATIILAPNGTGKSTIFEAIELALTGEIKRINNSPIAIIRNRCSEMSVKVDFSGGEFIESKYTKSGGLTRTEICENLFDVDKTSVSYLFRLTHYLEQRTENWLIEQKGSEAGKQLSQLPLGKDLQSILLKKTGLIKAIGNYETIAGSKLVNVEKKISDFNNLKQKRNSVSVATKSISPDEIVCSINGISKSVNYDCYQGEYSLILVDDYFERLKVFASREYSIQKDLISRLSILKERIGFFVSNSELINQKQQLLSNYSEKIDVINHMVEKTNTEIQNEGDLLAVINDKINRLNKEKALFEAIEQEKGQCINKNAELVQNDILLANFQKVEKETIEYLEKIERIRDQHKMVLDEITTRGNYLTSIEFKRDYQKKWLNLIIINKGLIDEKIPVLEKKKNEYTELISCLNGEVSDAENTYQIKRSALEGLTSAKNAIQEAVSSIKMNLPLNQRKCPVCQAEYEPGELMLKIEASLKAIDPSIPQAIEEERKALMVLETAKEKRNAENRKLLEIATGLNLAISNLEENQKKIAESYKMQFSFCKTPEEAEKYIDTQIEQTMLELHKLKERKNLLEPEVSSEEYNKIKLKKGGLEREVANLLDKRQVLQNEIRTLEEDINRINESLNGKERNSILQGLSDNGTEFEKKKAYILELNQRLLNSEEELKRHQNLLFEEKDTISKLKGTQDGILTEWRQAGFDDQPNQEKYKVKYDEVSKSVEELEQIDVRLSAIEQEISGWRTLEKYNEADKEIKNLIGSASEEDYLKELEKSAEHFTSVLQNISEKKGALTLFFENIIEENKEINKQLNSINEPWKKLLKRIINNPLVSSPTLSNSTSYNKLTTKTDTIIHGHSIDITKIASEAQITDLQLTLMLAMASKYQWTKWRGFLLDDPTQHHDLVRASSVFDVLRDYIIDLDYQVLMSTHDSTHARFFHRKLENEGVPSKIYQLVARKNGVTAERIF